MEGPSLESQEQGRATTEGEAASMETSSADVIAGSLLAAL